MSQVQYYSFLNLMESVGGIASFLSAFIYIILAYFMRNQWTESIMREVSKQSSSTETDKETDVLKIQSKIRTRVSYEGIYRLHDLVNFLDTQVTDLQTS